MKALTIWEPWASLIIEGHKKYEFRTWPGHKSIVGQRIVIHSAARKWKAEEIGALLNDWERLKAYLGDMDDEQNWAKALSLLERVWRDETTLPFGCALGTAILGQPARAIDTFSTQMDPDDINPDIWAWPLTDIIKFKEPIPAKGMQGFWNWKGPTGD